MSKYLPTNVALSVFNVDYDTLYAKGKKIILFDLDNTLISYDESVPSPELIKLGEQLLEKGFKVFVLTNNHGYRINHFMETFPATKAGYSMRKPFAYKIRRFLKNNQVNDYGQVVMIGDQLLTDIKCANRLGVESILVKSISRTSEHLYTRLNRLREKNVIKQLAKIDEAYAKQIAELIKKEKN